MASIIHPPLEGEGGCHLRYTDKRGVTWHICWWYDFNSGVVVEECIAYDDGGEWRALSTPQFPTRFWSDENDFAGAVAASGPAGQGNMGTFAVKTMPRVQAIANMYFDPTPQLPDHTNVEPATIKGINEVLGKYFVWNRDPTDQSAPVISTPAAG